jgi:pilus assembly protein CpaE
MKMPAPLDTPRHVLVIGSRLAPIAAEAMPSAFREVVEAEALGSPDSLHAAIDVILIDLEAAEVGTLTALIDAIGRRETPPAVLLAGANLPVVLVKALMRLPKSDVLEAPFTSVDLARAVDALSSAHLVPSPAAPPPPRRSHCWTVTGSVGGCGATTIVVEMATSLARRHGPGRVALVDLNLSGGAACAYLGASANMLLAEASYAPERIDAAMLDAFAMKIPGGPDVLACPRDARAYAKIGAEAVCKTLEVACQAYEFVVVDLPRHHQAWTLDVLAGSDEILVVSELTVPALLAARDLAGEIEADLEGREPPRIVLNRLASRVFGPAPSLAEAEKALQRKAFGGVTSDWEAAAASVNLGGAIAQHRPRSKIVRDVDALVAKLLEPHGASAAAVNRRVA